MGRMYEKNVCLGILKRDCLHLKGSTDTRSFETNDDQRFLIVFVFLPLVSIDL